MRQPRLRPGVGAGIDQNGRFRLIFFADSRHVVFDAHPAVADTVRLLDLGLPTEELFDQVHGKHSEFTVADLQEILEALRIENALEDAADDLESHKAEGKLFRRQIEFFADFTPTGVPATRLQDAIKRASVAVIGVGGTGTWMAQSLALVGVGRLRLIDPDVVDETNLSRQVLFGQADIGRAKADVAAGYLTARSGGRTVVEALPVAISAQADLDSLLAGSDLVINCADQPDINTTSDWIADACVRLRIPHLVGGGYAGHFGLIGPTIIPFETTCWRCFRADAIRRRGQERIKPVLEHRKRHTAAIAPLAAIVANLQVWDAMRVLTRMGPPLFAGRLTELDLRTAQLSWREVPRSQDCPTCHEEPTR